MTALTPDQIRDLTVRLVGIPSVSAEGDGERACAAALAEALPHGIEHGFWPGADGRPIVWAFLAGRAPQTVLLLGHLDTVGSAEYEDLGDPAGAAVACRPDALRATLERLAVDVSRGAAPQAGDVPPMADLPQRLRDDLAEDARVPGTWLFGRGALDMKSGLAAGVAALAALAADGPPPGHVLFVATPDEERESAGMIAAVPEIDRMRRSRGLDLIGAINLDFVAEPGMWRGVVGKLEAGCYVLGLPTHAGQPLDGVDALQLVAEVVKRVTERRELVDRDGDRIGPPPTALRLRDLKTGYNVQTAREAVAEFNIVTFGRPVANTMAILRDAAVAALEAQAQAHRELADWLGSGRRMLEPGTARTRVLTYPELVERAGARASGAHPASAVAADARDATLERLRMLCRAAGVAGPAVIVYALPPYYPPASPGAGRLARAADDLARAERLPLRPYYPFVSDASYVAWRGEPLEAVAAHLPSLGREYRLPYDAACALDLDVVTLGPWGRDAHGLFERVHAPYAFERLPGLIADLVLRAFGT